ncbi:hypothetical protein DBT_1130 [Dissulfuribacter thermophilus]|uniref:Uncharacterized protein n=1 Tax=Dissulfuribacter thermophilus TaxID=1156395 RepID=A0A1B9F680_9BACT|nr:DsrE family protein [Dissulfuribacter thermophilus]OCC15383.1 hypothetical protein DBT_1130 [Dissulfuribacter thermophilus]
MKKEVKKLLIHVGQKERWEVSITNAENFLKAAKEGEELEVVIIANADSVLRVKECDRQLFDKMKQFVLDGGKIFLCENSLNAFGISKNSLAGYLGTVPAAIMALYEYQKDGWVYVRP